MTNSKLEQYSTIFLLVKSEIYYSIDSAFALMQLRVSARHGGPIFAYYQLYRMSLTWYTCRYVYDSSFTLASSQLCWRSEVAD